MSERDRNADRQPRDRATSRNPLIYILVITLAGMALLASLDDEEVTEDEGSGRSGVAESLSEGQSLITLEDFFANEGGITFGGNFEDQDLQDRDFRGAVITASNFADADLSEMDLEGTRFGASNLADANFSDANLKDAVFVGTNLNDADFSNACLLNARIIASSVDGASFENAYIVGLKTEGVDMDDADLDGAILEGDEICPD